MNESPSVTPSKMYSPLFGVSNAYFLTQPPPLKTILENAATSSNTTSIKTKNVDKFQPNPSSPALPENLIKDIPNLLSQVMIVCYSFKKFRLENKLRDSSMKQASANQRSD